MVRKTGVALVMAGMLMWSSNASAISVENQLTFDELMAGNARFAAGLTLDNLALKSLPAERSTTALAQTPKVIVLDCSDSRLPPEIIFDKGLGELFVIRVAGNVIAPHQIASIEYAIEHLGAKTVMILGHERCGGVTAAYGSFDATGAPLPAYSALTPALQNLVSSMQPAVVATKSASINSVTAAGTSATDCILNNTHLTMTDLKTQSTVIAGLLALPTSDPLHDELLLVEAFYDLEDGKVTVTRASGNPLVPVTTIATTAETAIHTVTSSAGLNGTISPSGASAAVNGGSQTYKVLPAAGYAVDLVTGTCPAGTWNGTSYVVSPVNASCNVAVSFKSIPTSPPAPVLVGPAGAGTAINPTYSFSAAAGATYYIPYVWDATANAGFFGNWTLAATACGGTSACSIVQTTPLATGHTYYWFMMSMNASGLGSWSQYKTFRVGP